MSTPSREQVEAFLQSVSVAADAAGLRLMCAELDDDVLCALSGDIVPKCGVLFTVHGSVELRRQLTKQSDAVLLLEVKP
jgi:hypothetical protein